MILLKDKEIRWSKCKIVDVFGKPYDKEDVYDYAKRVADLVSEVNTKAQLKKVVEELKKEDARMYTGILDNPDMVIVKLHKDFWQSLLEEVR